MFQSSSCPVHKLFLVFCTMRSTSSAHTRASPSEYVRTYESSRLRRRRRRGRRVQQLFRSFREPSISSATRRETPASCLVCHDRPSRTRYSSFPPPSVRRTLYSERPVGRDNGRNDYEKEKSYERGGERRRRTVARVATSIRFSSSCGEVVKTFLLPPEVGVVTRTARPESSSVIIICLHC